MTRIRSSVQDEFYLRQLFQIGVLMEFESLLSCHGDELGMLEDMTVGVSDLATVSFKVVKASNADDVMPVIKGNR
jgi:inositol polyphosphate-4-phosphatase